MKKGFKNRLMMMAATLSTAIMTWPMTALADSTAPNFENVSAPIISLIKQLQAPVLGIVGALGSIYCILLGVKFAKAEEPQEREKAKSHLKNAIIGFVLIFVLLVVLAQGMPILIDWVSKNS